MVVLSLHTSLKEPVFEVLKQSVTLDEETLKEQLEAVMSKHRDSK